MKVSKLNVYESGTGAPRRGLCEEPKSVIMVRNTLYETKEFKLLYDKVESTWRIINGEKDVALNIGSSMVPGLLILYEEPVNFYSQVKKSIAESKLNESILDSLPITDIIQFCFKNELTYWCEESLKWLDFITLSKGLKEQLLIRANDRESPQKLKKSIIHYLTKKGIQTR